MANIDINALIQKLVEMFDKSSVEADKQGMLAAANKGLISAGLGGTTRAGAVSAGLTSELENQRKTNMFGALQGAAGLLQTEKQFGLAEKGYKLQEAMAKAQYGRWGWDKKSNDLTWQSSFGSNSGSGGRGGGF